MTRKDFERAAQILALIQHNPGDQATLAMAFCHWFASTNPRFDQDRFLAAVEKYSAQLRRSLAA